MAIKIDSRKVFYVLMAITFLLVLAHFIVTSAIVGDEKKTLNRFFNLDAERNFPTLFSTVNLLISGSLLSIISLQRFRTNKQDFKHWLGLAVIFSFLAVDEFISIHERVGNILQNALDTEGYLYFAWVIPYSVLLLFFAFFYAKFVFRLPGRIRIQFMVAGCLFVLGAIGVEMISAHHVYVEGTNNFSYNILTSFEETLEMVAIILFIRSLLEFMELEWQGLFLRLGQQDED